MKLRMKEEAENGEFENNQNGGRFEFYIRKRMPVRAATRAFPQKGSPVPDAATPKGKLQRRFLF
jgi:hypothetical protein